MANTSPESASTDTTGTRSASVGPSETERAPNTLLNALIGGVVGVVLSFIPFSTVLGGGVAGYLEGGESTDGAKVGALAGLVALVPFVFIFGIVLFFIPVMVSPGFQAAIWVSILFILCIATVYTVGFSILGGVLGVYLKEEV